MIKWRLKALMGECHVKNVTLAAELGVDPRVVSRWRHPSYVPELLNVKYLNGMCRVLKCQPGDLIQYVPDDETKHLSAT